MVDNSIATKWLLLNLIMMTAVSSWATFSMTTTAFTLYNTNVRNNEQTSYHNRRLFSSNGGGDGAEMSGDTINNDLLLIREFLQTNYPTFYPILDRNEDIWKAIGDTTEDGDVGFTVFVPSVDAFASLGEKKQTQLFDERNLETIQKIAGYHVIGEPVDEKTLYNSGGLITCSGEVPVERSVSGGFLGVGGKEDGGVTINQAKILRTATVGNGFVHEVDNLVAPQIVWRFMDQLRIPGST